MKNFSDLTEQELLALAIALEEEDSRTYADLADAMHESYPGTARMFAAMAEEGGSERRIFLLQIVQPGLAGLMDGSVATLAPLFAAAFATRETWPTFLVGLAAAIGAGISMGFAEALSDNGSLTGRGSPWARGIVCGAMTELGGLGLILTFLVPSFTVAMTIAVAVVIVELAAISWVRNRYMDTPVLSAAFQVFVGGLLVFATGIAIGSG